MTGIKAPVRCSRTLKRGIALWLAALGAIWVPAEAAVDFQTEVLMLTHVEGTVDVAADGSVSKFEVFTGLDQELKSRLVRRIQAWRFHPSKAEAPGKVAWRVTLAKAPDASNDDLRLDSVIFLPAPNEFGEISSSNHVDPLSRMMHPPIFPKKLMKSGLDARVLLALRYRPDGSLEAAVPMQTMIPDANLSPRKLSTLTRLFEGAVLAAARNWRADSRVVPLTENELVDLALVDFQLRDSVLHPLDLAESWRLVNRLTRSRPPWLGADVTVPGVADTLASEGAIIDGPRLVVPIGHDKL